MGLSRRGFSLLEVVIAVSIFATGIIVVLGLMGAMAGRSNEATESITALSLPHLVESTLREQSNNDFTRIQNFVGSGSSLIANHAGDVVSENQGVLGTKDDAFFLVELEKLNSSELTELDSVIVPIGVTVSWPYKPFGADGVSQEADRSSVSFNLAISR